MDFPVVLPSHLPLECGRIRLRPWRPSDVDAWYALAGLDAAWRETSGPYFPQPSQEEVDAYAAKMRARIDEGKTTKGGHGAVIAQSDTDAFLGEVTWYWECEHTCWPSVGILMPDETTWGQGLGYEAFGTWVDLLFRTFDFHRMDLRTWSGHHGMCRLADKLGFREEARFREARPLNGVRHDSVAYGMLKSEWDELHPEGFGPRPKQI
ncbi:MAG: GNAT family N-acetyltransferase [Myxococcales bacterium]|nr:GNAT family N-acetyltransferase [Myxococcales bacterium]